MTIKTDAQGQRLKLDKHTATSTIFALVLNRNISIFQGTLSYWTLHPNLRADPSFFSSHVDTSSSTAATLFVSCLFSPLRPDFD